MVGTDEYLLATGLDNRLSEREDALNVNGDCNKLNRLKSYTICIMVQEKQKSIVSEPQGNLQDWVNQTHKI